MENYQALENMKDFENLGSLNSKPAGGFGLNPISKGGLPGLKGVKGAGLGQVMMQNQMAS